jgi:branched-chain amino acid transport system substrate-binding protein
MVYLLGGLKGIARSILITTVIILIVIAGVGGYLYYINTQRISQEVNEIKVGLLFPLTGSMAPLGIDEMVGVRILIDLINERGGILVNIG